MNKVLKIFEYYKFIDIIFYLIKFMSFISFYLTKIDLDLKFIIQKIIIKHF